ncbi:MAG: alpha-E domain-containing protein [Phycisphaerae bacterium]|nr:alpha-E domain-containing protein [Phycisphaerae bacterium]
MSVDLLHEFPAHSGQQFARPSARPMLSRDADSMYWMARYIERAEHIARLLLVNSNVLIDVGDLTPALLASQWTSVLTIVRQDPDDPELAGDGPIGQRVARFMTLDRGNPSSIISCIGRARENARAIRENISAEMWETLNSLYWSVQSEDAQLRFDESPDEFYRAMMNGSMLFQGLTDQTLAHDQRWLFTQVAKYLERIDVTARTIETKFHILQHSDGLLETALRNIHWMAVLRSCCSIEAYRRNHVSEMEPLRVAAFLILERSFPRSIRFSVERAMEAVAAIHAGIDPSAVDPAERVLGRLNAQLEYAEMVEILNQGLPAYLQQIQHSVAEAALAIQRSYFLL